MRRSHEMQTVCWLKRRLAGLLAMVVLMMSLAQPGLAQDNVLSGLWGETSFRCTISAEGTLGRAGTQCDLADAGLPSTVQVMGISIFVESGGGDLEIRRGAVAHGTTDGVSNFARIPAGGGLDQLQWLMGGTGLDVWQVKPSAGTVTVSGYVVWRRP